MNISSSNSSNSNNNNNRHHDGNEQQQQQQQQQQEDPRPTDVLTLNVGGEGILTVERRILTQVQGSLLEAKFSGRWNQESRDCDGNIFISHRLVIFKPLVDYLLSKWCDEPLAGSETEPPSLQGTAIFQGRVELFKQFLIMVRHYGLLEVMYPALVVEAGHGMTPAPDEIIPLAYYGKGPLSFTVTLHRRYFYLQPTNTFSVPGHVISSLRIELLENPGDTESDYFMVAFVDPDKELPIRGRFDVRRNFGSIFPATKFAQARIVVSTTRSTTSASTSNTQTKREVWYTDLGRGRMKSSEVAPNIPPHYVVVFGGRGSWTLHRMVVTATSGGAEQE